MLAFFLPFLEFNLGITEERDVVEGCVEIRVVMYCHSKWDAYQFYITSILAYPVSFLLVVNNYLV